MLSVQTLRLSGACGLSLADNGFHPTTLLLRLTGPCPSLSDHLVQRSHRVVPAPAGDLHQGGRMRHPSTQRDAAKPLPGNRIGHLPETAARSPTGSGTSKTSTANRSPPGLTGDRSSIEIRRERRKEHWIIQQRTRPSQLGRQQQQLRGQTRVPQRRLVTYSSEHDGLDPFWPRGSRSSSRPHSPTSGTATPRLFQILAPRV